ncbi:MAG: 3-hydroxyacyl-CoA dehydrogenase family protein [Solirubrobacteraceae bacterium]
MQERLGIAGSGAIACGLAATAARHADDVVLWARSDESAARARAAVEKVCGRLSGAVQATHVRVVTDMAELNAATYVVEAIAEDLEAKSQLLAQLGVHLAPEAILATTTSSLSVEALAAAGGAPERFAGLHVFNPVPKMKLVEVIFPQAASEETRERTPALCDDLGKTAVVVPDSPGFVVNRLLFPFLFSAVDLLDSSGLAPQAIDECMKLGAAHPMGPLELLDFVGLDVAEAIGDEIGVSVPERVRGLVAEGATGRKAGRGLYDYAVA